MKNMLLGILHAKFRLNWSSVRCYDWLRDFVSNQSQVSIFINTSSILSKWHPYVWWCNSHTQGLVQINLSHFLYLFIYLFVSRIFYLFFIFWLLLACNPDQLQLWVKWNRWKRRPKAWRHRLRWDWCKALIYFMILISHRNQYLMKNTVIRSLQKYKCIKCKLIANAMTSCSISIYTINNEILILNNCSPSRRLAKQPMTQTWPRPLLGWPRPLGSNSRPGRPSKATWPKSTPCIGVQTTGENMVKSKNKMKYDGLYCTVKVFVNLSSKSTKKVSDWKWNILVSPVALACHMICSTRLIALTWNSTASYGHLELANS